MIRSRWIMQWLAYVLLILGSLGTLANGLGYAPLVRFIPALLLNTLPLLLTLGCLGVLLGRLYRLEHTVSQTQEHHAALQAQCQNAARCLEALRAEARQLAQALPDMQQATACNEWLWPGKLLLSQQRYDEAIKVFQDALVRAPEHPSLHWSLGEALCGARRYAEALPHLRAGL